MLTGAAPSLPEAYSMAIHGAPVGPKSGSCGTAAWRDDLAPPYRAPYDDRYLR